MTTDRMLTLGKTASKLLASSQPLAWRLPDRPARSARFPDVLEMHARQARRVGRSFRACAFHRAHECASDLGIQEATAPSKLLDGCQASGRRVARQLELEQTTRTRTRARCRRWFQVMERVTARVWSPSCLRRSCLTPPYARGFARKLAHHARGGTRARTRGTAATSGCNHPRRRRSSAPEGVVPVPDEQAEKRQPGLSRPRKRSPHGPGEGDES